MGFFSLHSELHDRLEYLVNYSSQLIFVSGDTIAQQQQNLEAFIYQQHDDTEIAYLTAAANMQDADYRGQLCRQLLGQVVGSFSRPLNELLSSLNEHEGPVLIAITQAQFLSDRLLQELWDLVLQSRFAGNKQHLNVLLFADSAWAENAKKWLPAKNTDTPLLISSQSIDTSNDHSQGSELDRMISQHREAFQARLDKRNTPAVLAYTNPLKSKRFYILIALVFVLTFGGLVTWQYGSALSSIFTPIETSPHTGEEDVVAGSAFDKVASTAEMLPPGPASSEPESPSQLVTQWPSAVSSLHSPQQTQSAGHINNSQSPLLRPSTTDSSLLSKQAVNNQIEPSSEEPSGAPIQQTPELNSAIIAQPEANQPPQLTPIADNVTSVIEWVVPANFVIQLVGMTDEVALNQFISRNNLTGLVRQYKTTRYGGDWHVLLFDQQYNSAQNAQAAIALLPDYPTKSDAFIKRGQQILNEVALLSSP